MPMLADTVDAVIGVDTHTDTHTACLVDQLGRQVDTITVPADPQGCAMLLAWAPPAGTGAAAGVGGGRHPLTRPGPDPGATG